MPLKPSISWWKETNGFQALISGWKGCISGLSDFEGCMKQGQTRHTEGTSLREIVTQTMKELRSQTGDSRASRDWLTVGDCYDLVWGHNKENQCPWSRGPRPPRTGGSKADLFCRSWGPRGYCLGHRDCTLASLYLLPSALQCLPVAKRYQKRAWKTKALDTSLCV